MPLRSPDFSSTIQFGRDDLKGTWYIGDTYYDTITASWTPPTWSFTELIAVPVPVDKNLYIYGYYIATQQANRFWIAWWRHGSLYVNEIEVPMGGNVFYEDTVPINAGMPANRFASDPTDNAYVYIFTTSTNPVATYYQGGLLIAEEPVGNASVKGLNI